MKKIPTLFVKMFDVNGKSVGVTKEVTPGMEWVFDGLGVATIKWDGTATMWKDGAFYKRYDAKRGKKIPENAIKCQEASDPVTGHMPCWVPVDEKNPADKWYIEGLKNYIEGGHRKMENRTYELVGKHFQSNPYHLDHDTLVPHGEDVVEVERTYDGIREWLELHNVEGLVFWKDGEPRCKIRRNDFGFGWK